MKKSFWIPFIASILFFGALGYIISLELMRGYSPIHDYHAKWMLGLLGLAFFYQANDIRKGVW
jgi:hypothetical protein